MLSDQTEKNLAAAFCRAANATLVRESGDVCNIVAATGAATGSFPSALLLLVTISSFVFRVVVIFQVSDGESTRQYYSGGAAGRPLHEAFSEVANMCCGAFNRELAAQFQHLAMSIPYALDARCIAFLNDLNPRYRASYDIRINDTAQLRATLCMCSDRPFEFSPPLLEVSHAGGELELL